MPARVDTGAEKSFLPVSWANALGLPVPKLGPPDLRSPITANIVVQIALCGHDYEYPVTVGFDFASRAVLSKNDFLDRFPASRFLKDGVQVKLPTEEEPIKDKDTATRKTYKGRTIELRGDFWYFLDTGEKVQF
jgi:hypothetical protein